MRKTADVKKIAKCPVCGNKTTSGFFALKGYWVSRCQNCSMVWDPAYKTEALGQYEKTYYINHNPKGGYANYFEGMTINKKTFEDRAKKIENRVGKGKLLDVGCAFGDFLDAAQKLGWKKVDGLEVSSYAVSKSKEKGLNVKKSTLDEWWSKNRNSYDVVTYQDVIEHITNPLSELKMVYKILKPGGTLFIVTPDIGGWWFKILRSYWYHFKPGEHVVYFSHSTMRLALEKTGFEKIIIRPTYHILSLEYIFNRLRYYSPVFFGTLLKVIRKSKLKDYAFKAYTGELEAWATKP